MDNSQEIDEKVLRPSSSQDSFDENGFTFPTRTKILFQAVRLKELENALYIKIHWNENGFQGILIKADDSDWGPQRILGIPPSMRKNQPTKIKKMIKKGGLKVVPRRRRRTQFEMLRSEQYPMTEISTGENEQITTRTKKLTQLLVVKSNKKHEKELLTTKEAENFAVFEKDKIKFTADVKERSISELQTISKERKTTNESPCIEEGHKIKTELMNAKEDNQNEVPGAKDDDILHVFPKTKRNSTASDELLEIVKHRHSDISSEKKCRTFTSKEFPQCFVSEVNIIESKLRFGRDRITGSRNASSSGSSNKTSRPIDMSSAASESYSNRTQNKAKRSSSLNYKKSKDCPKLSLNEPPKLSTNTENKHEKFNENTLDLEKTKFILKS